MQDFSQNDATGDALNILGRRLRGLAMISRGIVPNLVISQRVIDKIALIARQYIEDETGESMVGFVVDDNDPDTMPTLYVVDTISPDDDNTLRQTHTFQQGDDLQDEIIWWLQENWRLYRERNRDLDPRFDTPLRYLGDWHKQPGFMIQPSGGDLMTALAWLDDPDNNMEYLLVPIITLGHEDVTSEEGAIVNYTSVRMGDGTNMRLDWWYIHQDVRVFQPITPRVMPASELPTLTAYPWHLTNPDRLAEEVAHMRDDQMFVEVLVWQADEDIPTELCFFALRPGGSHVMLIITEHDYPATPPRVRVAPFTSFDHNANFYTIFESFWHQSKPVADPPGWQWTPDTPLIDYIYEIEDHLGIQRPDLPKPDTTHIPVQIEDDAPPAHQPPKTTQSPKDEDPS